MDWLNAEDKRPSRQFFVSCHMRDDYCTLSVSMMEIVPDKEMLTDSF